MHVDIREEYANNVAYIIETCKATLATETISDTTLSGISDELRNASYDMENLVSELEESLDLARSYVDTIEAAKDAADNAESHYSHIENSASNFDMDDIENELDGMKYEYTEFQNEIEALTSALDDVDNL